MKKIFPSDEKFSFLFCEDIRQETGGKLSLMGVFAGGVVGLDVPEKNLQGDNCIELQSLCFYFSFRDGEGEFSAKTRVFDPEGTEIYALPAAPVLKRTGHSLAHAFKLAPFRVERYGEFKVTITLDDHDYSAKFQIIQAAEANTQPSPV